MILYSFAFWTKDGLSGEIVSDCMDVPAFNVFDDSRPNSNGEI